MFNPIKRYTHWLHTRWPAGVVEKLPESGEFGVTNIPGVRIVGDLTGIPLLKFSSKTGAEAVRAILQEPDFVAGGGDADPDCASLGEPGSAAPATADEVLDLAIIGGGVSGVSAAIEAQKARLKFKIFEATQPFSTVANFPKAKPIYTYPTELKLEGGLQFRAKVKEPLLEEMEEQRKAAGIEFTDARIERIEARGKEILLHHGDKAKTITRARRVIVAIGRSGNHRRLGCPGEDLDKVYNRLYDPKDFSGQECARRRRWRQCAGMRDRAGRLRREGHGELSQAGVRASQTGECRETENAGARSEGGRAGGTAELGAGDDRVHERDDEERAARFGHAGDGHDRRRESSRTR